MAEACSCALRIEGSQEDNPVRQLFKLRRLNPAATCCSSEGARVEISQRGKPATQLLKFRFAWASSGPAHAPIARTPNTKSPSAVLRQSPTIKPTKLPLLIHTIPIGNFM